MRIKERIRIKKSLFLSRIYTDLAIRATLREPIRIMIYNIHFFFSVLHVYYIYITRVIHSLHGVFTALARILVAIMERAITELTTAK